MLEDHHEFCTGQGPVVLSGWSDTVVLRVLMCWWKGCSVLVMGFGPCVEVCSSPGPFVDNGIVYFVLCELTGSGNRCLVGTCECRDFGLDGILSSVHGQRSLSSNRVKESVILVLQQCMRTHLVGLFRARTPQLHLAHFCVVLLL